MRASVAWICLSISALCQVAWVVSLRLFHGGSRIGPLALYAGSGLGAAIFLALAMRGISMSAAYAAWLGLSLVGTLGVDVLVFHESWSLTRAASALLILAGACGLKLAATP